jgi:hypothetical protein
MNINIDFDERVRGFESFSAKDRSEQIDFVIDLLERDGVRGFVKPESYLDEDLLKLFNKNNKEYKLSLEEFSSSHERMFIGDIILMLVPKSKHQFWFETTECFEEELGDLYAGIWGDLLEGAGIEVNGSLQGTIGEDITVSFIYKKEKFTYSYLIPEYMIDEKIFQDFDDFCEKIEKDLVFLVDGCIGDETIGGYILPKRTASEVAKYLYLEY